MATTTTAPPHLESFINLTPLEIPRPKCQGMQFVPTRGRYGFYRTIRAEGSKFGVQIKTMGPRRPVLSKELFTRPQTVQEEDERQDSAGSMDSVHSAHDSSTSSQASSISSDRSSPVEIEPDYPVDDDDQLGHQVQPPTVTRQSRQNSAVTKF